ncbi:ejaculatory bulb-specific protein 3-like [Coccinella septempunctata]|uniref:ejaculatory bulb-specific protein 3-like n=1 Tax=Coccinella septempunctata TaxID=41139 RepID=UPI001D071A8E|nr:ejaculatory bulb-specific protein 3-like [Coccinella septempunctata]
MKNVVICSIFICAVAVWAEEKYTTKFGNIDLDELLKNDRLLNAYYKCLLDGTGCTPEGEELGKILPDAIQTGCVKCTDEQKAGAKKVASYLIKEKAQWWEALLAKYDPDNTYRVKFKDQLKAEGFDL